MTGTHDGSGIRSVLFVCTANICRSAYADVLTAEQDVPGLSVSSAGTHGWVDHPMDDHMAAELASRGADPTGFRSRRLTTAMLDEADLVLTATAAHRTFVLQERPIAVRKTFTLGQLATAIATLSPEVVGTDMLREARRARATAAASDDVRDPYGRGAAAAAEAADHIDSLLVRILPRLRAAAPST